MKERKQLDAGRRSAIVKLAGGGIVGAAGLHGLISTALAAERKQGFTHIKGTVTIDGKPVSLGQPVRPGQRVITGPGSEAVFVIGRDAFMQRGDSEFGIDAGAGVTILRFITGKVLSVFGRGRKELRTPTATIGIRGTGCYIEAEAVRTYFCLCYGEAELVPAGDPKMKEVIRTRHHEYPLYIGKEPGSSMMAKGPVLNHTDAELIMLESLVGRVPPFQGQNYPGYLG